MSDVQSPEATPEAADAAPAAAPEAAAPAIVQALADLARPEPSGLVRLALTSALQRLPARDRPVLSERSRFRRRARVPDRR